jgi:hypothetical protein
MVMRASNHPRVVAAAVAVVVPACFHPVYDHLACGPGDACPADQLCIQNVCEDKHARTFDSATDFARGQLASMSVDARGVLTPTAYSYGGLVASGLQGEALWHPGAADWSAVDGVTPSGAGLWRGDPITSTNDLDYLGVSSKAVMTIWLEGEVWLDASMTETFSLQANDIGFLEVAAPGTADYVRLVDSVGNVASTGAGPYRPPITGWYPIRVGFSDSDNQGSLKLLHGDGSGPLVAWTRDRMRARASELDGALRTVFFQQVLGGGDGAVPPVAHFENADLLRRTTFPTVPQGTRNPVNWSARYVAQVYIQQAGSYTLTITSDDGNRGRLGAMSGQTSWALGDETGNAVTHVTSMLRAGWNDLTVDYNQIGGPQALRVQLDGPDFANNIEVPRDRLRPVESADDRLAYGGDDTNYMVPDGGGAGSAADAVMPVVGFPGETVASLDLLYEVMSQHWEHVRVDLETPGTASAPGKRVTIRVDDKSLGQGDHIAQLTIPASATGSPAGLLGGPANGTWKLHVYKDAADGDAMGMLDTAKLTLHTTAGPERIARMASWTSPVQDFDTDVDSIASVTWSERVPGGTSVRVLVRSCHQQDCSDGVWMPAPDQATRVAARYLQLRVEMTSDGVSEPELGDLRLVTR